LTWLPRLGLFEGFGTGALVAYIALWFVISVVNLGVGIYYAGYTVAEELPIMALVFGVPALGAVMAWK
jgi:hypothetical protein